MQKRFVGNRRSEEELEALKILNNKTAFKLREDQDEFIGTREQLEMMQNAERAYISGHPIMTDEEWDILKEKHKYKESITSVSPSGRNWVKFNSPLPSLNKGGSLEDLDEFLNKFDKNQKFIVQCKLDGLTANLKYKRISEKEIYELDSISSRGNGRFGLELNPYALSGVKLNFPKEIKTNDVFTFLNDTPDEFEIRGEAVIPKNNHSYKKYGENAVWRNIASGMFNRKAPFNLEGVVQYITDGKETIESLCSKNGYYTFKPEFKGRKCINPEVYNNMKLIASLFEDNVDFIAPKRGDYLTIYKDGNVIIYYSDGITKGYYDDGEELDIVIYSISINGSNIDLTDFNGTNSTKRDLFNNLGFKAIWDIEFQEDLKEQLLNYGYRKTFRITDERNRMYEAVNEFYGINPKTNKRDINLQRLRNMYEYACDGVVLKLVGSNKYTQNIDLRLGRNGKIIQPEYPEDQLAIKMLSETVRVKLDHIERKETSLGNITCTGILDKPYRTESGALVSNVNLHNPEWLQANSWIKEGEEYDLIMSLDIIPVLLNPEL